MEGAPSGRRRADSAVQLTNALLGRPEGRMSSPIFQKSGEERWPVGEFEAYASSSGDVVDVERGRAATGENGSQERGARSWPGAVGQYHDKPQQI